MRHSPLPLQGALVVVSMANLVQIRDQLIESLPVDDQTGDPVRRITNDIRCAQIIALQRLLAEEVALGQRPNELLVRAIALANRHLHLSL